MGRVKVKLAKDETGYECEKLRVRAPSRRRRRGYRGIRQSSLRQPLFLFLSLSVPLSLWEWRLKTGSTGDGGFASPDHSGFAFSVSNLKPLPILFSKGCRGFRGYVKNNYNFFELKPMQGIGHKRYYYLSSYLPPSPSRLIRSCVKNPDTIPEKLSGFFTLSLLRECHKSRDSHIDGN